MALTEQDRAEARAMRVAMDKVGSKQSDVDALEAIELYRVWMVDREYIENEIVRHPSKPLLFRVVANHTSNAAYQLETTFAYYRLIELTHAGTKADPIPYPEEPGILVAVVNGKYYSYKGTVYKATQDVPNCSWYPGQAGVHFWEKA